jgi:hypothetical protein
VVATCWTRYLSQTPEVRCRRFRHNISLRHLTDPPFTFTFTLALLSGGARSDDLLSTVEDGHSWLPAHDAPTGVWITARGDQQQFIAVSTGRLWRSREVAT